MDKSLLYAGWSQRLLRGGGSSGGKPQGRAWHSQGAKGAQGRGKWGGGAGPARTGSFWSGRESGNFLGSFSEPGSRLIGRFAPARAPGPRVSVRKLPLPSDPTSNLAPSKVLRPTREGAFFAALTPALRGAPEAPPTPRRLHRGARLWGAARPERGWRPLRQEPVHAPRRLGKAAGAGRASRRWPREHLSPGSPAPTSLRAPRRWRGSDRPRSPGGGVDGVPVPRPSPA